MSAFLVLMIILVIMLILKTPLFVALGVSSMVVLIMDGLADINFFASATFTATNSYPLLAIPLFILAGDIMCAGGIAKRLVRFLETLIGSFTGGLGMIAICACFIFASISGSGPATVATIGGIMLTYMAQQGYSMEYSAALIASAGSMGPIVPPSITFVLFGVLAGASVGDLFIAGIVPGLLMALTLLIVNYIISKKGGYRGVSKATGKDVLKALNEAKLSLLTPVIVLGGIYGGICTPTEAAAVSVIYALIVSLAAYKEISIKDLPSICMKSSVTSAGILIIIGIATFFGRIIGLELIPQMLADSISRITSSPIVILMIINVILLIAGMFMDTVAALMIFVPLLMPVATAAGIDIIHFGMIVGLNLTIGTITPPLGVNIFVASKISGVSVEKLFHYLKIFIVALLIPLLIITLFPELSLFLPNLFGGR